MSPKFRREPYIVLEVEEIKEENEQDGTSGTALQLYQQQASGAKEPSSGYSLYDKQPLIHSRQ